MLNLLQQLQGQVDIGAIFIGSFLIPIIVVAICEAIKEQQKDDMLKPSKVFKYVNYNNDNDFIIVKAK